MPKTALVILIILAIIIFLIFAVSFIANIRFKQKVAKEVHELFAGSAAARSEIRQDDLAELPPCVQKWLENSGVVGKKMIRTVRLKQKGSMRTKEDGPWMPVEAEQYFTVDEPGFVWQVKVRIAPLLSLTGRDRYYEGHGTMLIKLISLIPVVDGKGKEMDQGTMLRYLAEMQWFPTAALSDYIKWEAIDADSARATMSYKGLTVSGVFTFNGQGELTGFVANRYREVNGRYELTEWGGLTKEYKDFDGIKIPGKGEVFWELETGHFDWYHWEITEVQYNKKNNP